jgi:predicted metal-dependent phosphotriesterase family hydrolase
MRRGVTYLPTNLRIDVGHERVQQWVDAIKRAFDEGFGDKLVLGLDCTIASGYHDGDGRTGETYYKFAPAVIPKPLYAYMFTHTLPLFRKLGLEDSAIHRMLVDNPKRILPVVKP